MKILFVQKMNGISGSELYMLQIMPELKRRGYDIQMLIIYPTKGDNNSKFIEHLASHGIKTHEIYGHGTMSLPLLIKISKLVKREKYDIVQSNLVHADFWIAMTKLLFNRKLKMISVKHGYNPRYQAKYGLDLRHLKNDIYFWVEKFASRMANFNVTISKGLYKVYVEGKITSASRIRNIYYGLTMKKPVYEANGQVMPNDPFVLITGRLISFKGHSYLIEAWKSVHKKHPSLKLYIAGDGYKREDLEGLVKSYGLQDSVVFLGHVPNPHPYMENCLFTIVSSIWEGFGLILLESWMHKKPIVAFNVPAMNEVIDHKQNGLLVKEKDSNDLADKVSYLYERRDLVKEFGENGYQKLNSYYTLQRMTDEMEQVYKAVYAGKPVPLEDAAAN
jgi:glycosyltransferase involved in cell wall biosynthesis